jgi:uncharacterized surface protein with fasciclin (FAS1) repeats
MKKGFTLLLAVLLLSLVAVTGPVAAQNGATIYDIARTSGDFEQLTAAVEQAGLAGTLDGPGPFTVYAPTDDAFAAFAASGIDPEATLQNILLYHVTAGAYTAENVVSRDSLPTVFGESIDVEIVDGAVVLDGRATVVATDIQASNGVIHVIDAVLAPPVNALDLSTAGDPDMTIAEIAAADGRFDTLLAALDAAGLAQTFANPGDYTVFAPTDAAFAALPAGTVEALLADPAGDLTTILLYHVVGDSLSINQIANDDFIPTLEGRPLRVTTDDSFNVSVDGAQIQLFNIRASNGVIHVIDSVMIP